MSANMPNFFASVMTHILRLFQSIYTLHITIPDGCSPPNKSTWRAVLWNSPKMKSPAPDTKSKNTAKTTPQHLEHIFLTLYEILWFGG